MKINIFKLIPVMMLLVALFITLSCQKDPVSIEDIRTDLPEITGISSDNLLPLPGDTIEVSVQASGGSSFSWTATSGTFSDAGANPTHWYAPEDGSGPQRLTCEVSNSAGSRTASITINVFEVIPPEGATGYWPFDVDFNDYNGEGVGPNDGSGDDMVSIDGGEFIRGIGSGLFEGEDEADNGILLAGGTDLDMGTDAEFTVTLWVKTEDEGLAFLFGKTDNGEFVEGGKCIYLEEGYVVFDLFGVGGFGSEEQYNDGEWHHIALAKEGTEIFVWIDGEWSFEGDLGDWRDDGDFVITMGAAWEAPGEGWPGTLQGNLDDVRFYPEVLSEEDIIAIYEGE